MPSNLNPENWVANQTNINSWQQQLLTLLKNNNLSISNRLLVNELKLRILEARQFFSDLSSSPDDLVHNFLNTITRNITAYEKKYPSGQTLIVRKACHQIKNMVTVNLVGMDDRQLRLQYLFACNWLWLIHEEMENKQTNAISIEFAATIAKLIKKSRIPIAGYFPDNLEVGFKVDDVWPSVKLMDDGVFLVAEVEEYEAEYNALEEVQRNLASINSDLTKTQAEAVTKLLNEINTKHTTENFDRKFAITVLRSTRELISQPADTNTYNNYLALAYQPDTTSTFRSNMLCALGCILFLAAGGVGVTVGMTCFALTGGGDIGLGVSLVAGLSSPVVAIGIGLAIGVILGLLTVTASLWDKSNALLKHGMWLELSSNIETVAQKFTYLSSVPRL